ncbi:hypothetical protein RN001_009080 [Aquatica leii]|uniref:THAP-type domain-containing protein n=1 Tax=Aquatica leii TaxID=1421715 RepID=A0AAN7PTD9_9COLE|nr:hypothetical protein RN001_009080 [Aquatica leii]
MANYFKNGKSIIKHMSVCSKHFSENAYCLGSATRQRKFLKKGALPSLNLPKGSIETKRQIKSRSLRLQAGSKDSASLDNTNCSDDGAIENYLQITDENLFDDMVNKDYFNLEQLANVASLLPNLPTNVDKEVQCNICIGGDGIIFAILKD